MVGVAALAIPSTRAAGEVVVGAAADAQGLLELANGLRAGFDLSLDLAADLLAGVATSDEVVTRVLVVNLGRVRGEHDGADLVGGVRFALHCRVVRVPVRVGQSLYIYGSVPLSSE